MRKTSIEPSSFLPQSISTLRALADMDTIYSHKRYSESWIEISSQASSSSVSSIPADDAHRHASGFTSGQQARRRRRLMRNTASGTISTTQATSTATSSQEEYEESESESDRILTSSNENVVQLSEGVSPAAPSSGSEEAPIDTEEDNDDENATALGVGTNERVFTPPANAFSHPPQATTTRHARSLETRTSYFPPNRTSPHRRSTANSYPSRSARTGHTPYNMISPSHQVDHDAALRASLSTLLSCAAAARGLPKREGRSTQQDTSGPSTNRIQPSTLRLVPESEIAGDDKAPDLPTRPSIRHRSSANSLTHNDQGKRKASSSKDRRNKKQRANSPAREASVLQVHPTLLTWVVSAGVVVLFSAISFSAGYAIGKEVGRVETLSGKDGVVCGKEVGRGLRRLRWGASSVSVIKV